MTSQSNKTRLNKRNDLTGTRFGKLTAIAPTGEKKNGYLIWRCRCDCGNEIETPSRYLKNGWTTDCGCVEKEKRYRDLTGQRFGKLVVQHVATERLPDGTEKEIRADDGRVLWECLCDCGNTILVPSTQLVAGYRKSCNCLSRPPRKEWIGRQFGKLTVIEYAGKWSGAHHWKCRCTCGNETVVSQSNLQNEHTLSCGCLVNPLSTRNFVEGTCIEMIRSKKVFSNNTSGVRGVYPLKRTGKWAAQIQFKGKKKFLGSFDTIEEAAAARKKAEEVYEDFLERFDAGEFGGEQEAEHVRDDYEERISQNSRLHGKKQKADNHIHYSSHSGIGNAAIACASGDRY